MKIDKYLIKVIKVIERYNYLLPPTLKFLMEEQTQIREQGVLFLKFTNRAGHNKRAGWEKSDKIRNEHALLLLFM